jgi:predicted GIY-YIG superfamily endonuclease
LVFYVYILLCADGTYYTGHTDNLERRVVAHGRGEIPGYTFNRRPVSLAFAQEFASRVEALAAERQIKGWNQHKKEALIKGEWERLPELAKPSSGKRKAVGK